MRELSAVRPDALKVAQLHKTQLQMKVYEIEDLQRKNAKLKRENAELRRQIDSSPGWAPGGLGENPTATGG